MPKSAHPELAIEAERDGYDDGGGGELEGREGDEHTARASSQRASERHQRQQTAVASNGLPEDPMAVVAVAAGGVRHLRGDGAEGDRKTPLGAATSCGQKHRHEQLARASEGRQAPPQQQLPALPLALLAWLPPRLFGVGELLAAVARALLGGLAARPDEGDVELHDGRPSKQGTSRQRRIRHEQQTRRELVVVARGVLELSEARGH
mmetsp:Transcript_95396/g.274716  ORF Transcript_95396/g.274716 Transcript_95396/m.274716 type:complete len:207 (+) Transcript_95396:407-1027(+)